MGVHHNLHEHGVKSLKLICEFIVLLTSRSMLREGITCRDLSKAGMVLLVNFSSIINAGLGTVCVLILPNPQNHDCGSDNVQVVYIIVIERKCEAKYSTIIHAPLVESVPSLHLCRPLQPSCPHQ